MRHKVTVRLPDELVAFIDRRVAAGEAPNRATVVAAAVERERRRVLGERDAAILAATSSDADDVDGLARFAATIAFDLD